VQGTPIADLEQALVEEVARLQKEPVAADELQRVKAQVMASKIFQRDSNFYQAMQLGMAETVGLGWRVVDEYVDRINQVTPEQVQQVAQKYLIDDRKSVAYLDPLPLPEGGEPPSEDAGHGGHHVR
jgi:zinc protease